MPPLDHYISQVHLRNFYSRSLGDRVFAMGKSDLTAFAPNSQSICRIDDDNTNPYLREPRAIEEFLKTVEPRYNRALEKLVGDNIDHEAIYTIAGFLAYVMTCSPGGMRILAEPPRRMIESAVAVAEAHGQIPLPPEELAGRSLVELLRTGDIEIEVDRQYPQAVGIANIFRFVAFFGNSAWEILVNPFDRNPFFTSDYPVGIESTIDPRVLNRIVPLAPNLAVRIMPDITIARTPPDFSFARFRYQKKNISRHELIEVNRLIVRCAEDTVFYRDDYAWVREFITRNRGYRIEHETYERSDDEGSLLFFRQRIVKFTPSPPEDRG